MENYQVTGTNYNQSEQKNVVHQVEVLDGENFGLAISNDENYNFGAELSKTIITPITKQEFNGEAARKTTTNTESIISTKTSTETDTETETEETFKAFAAPELPCAATTTATTTIITTIPTPIDSALGSEQCEYDTADENGDDDDGQDDDQQQHSHHYLQNPVSSEDDTTTTSTDSDFSDISGLSDVSGKEWKPATRKPILWVQKQIHSGRNPRELLSRFLPAGAQSITLGLNDMSLWRLLANVLSEPPRRQKLRYINTFDDVLELILRSENIIVLTGAGVSVSCGIPDFRSSDGIYSRLAKDYPNLPDPQAMFDIDYFSRDPRPFYKFAREIYPGQFKPSPCHRFIKLLEEKQRLLRNYTQNIDTLEQVAGIKRVIECHGSFSTASCTKCKYKCDAEAIREDIFAQRIPACPRCQPDVQQSVDAADPVSEYDLRLLVANGIMKPDIVFFGEGLPEEFHKVMASDKDKCDLLIVIGSSLKVRPVALIPSSIPANVPQILINREQLNHLEFDVELLGDSDVIINQICHRLGNDWKTICFNEQILQESKELRPFDEIDEDVEVEEEATTSVETIEADNDDETCQINDIDTQSIKSNASTTDLAFRSTAAVCSVDSGFESSTSIGHQTSDNLTKSNIDSSSPNYEIESIINTDVLECNDEANHQTKSICEKVKENEDFHPFSSHHGQESGDMSAQTKYGGGGETAGQMRHLSIDSTKDSGIQCDSSNSTVTTTTTGICSGAEMNYDAIASSSTTIPRQDVKIATTPSGGHQNLKRRHRPRSCSAADFLVEGTYYYHKNSSSYIFPGAQISWYADSDSEFDEDDTVNSSGECNAECQNNDDDDDNDDDDNARDDLDNKCDEGNCSQDSQEYNENYRANITECTTTTTTTTNDDDESVESKCNKLSMSRTSACYKRRSSGDRFYQSVEEVSQKNICSLPPPIKKHRSTSDETSIIEVATKPATTTTTTTVLTSSLNSDDIGTEDEQENPTSTTNSVSVSALTTSATSAVRIVETIETSTTISTTAETLQDM